MLSRPRIRTVRLKIEKRKERYTSVQKDCLAFYDLLLNSLLS